MAWSDYFTEAWRYQGSNETEDRMWDCAVDGSDDLFLAGYIEDNFAAIKLDGSTGNLAWIWTETYGNDTVDALKRIAIDSEGYALACGVTSAGEDVEDQSVAIKLDRDNGTKVWQYNITAVNSTDHEGNAESDAIAVDHEDNVFIAGHVTGHLTEVTATSDDFSDIFVIKLDGGTGSEEWTVQHGNASEGSKYVHRIRADSEGDLIMIGNRRDDGASSIFAIKVNGCDGSILWEYERETDTDDYAWGADIDAAGDAVIGGTEDQNGLTSLADTGVVIKLDGYTGEEIWIYNSDVPNVTFEGMAVDPINGYITAAGHAMEDWIDGAALGSYDLAAVVLNSETGTEIVRYQDGTDGFDRIRCAHYGSDGSLYFGGSVTGNWAEDSSGSKDYMGMKFDPMDTSAGDSDGDFSMETWQIALGAAGCFCLLLLSCMGVWRMGRKRDKSIGDAGLKDQPGSRGRSRTFLPVSARVGYPHNTVHPHGTHSG